MLLMELLHGLFVREYVFSPSEDNDGATLYVCMYVCIMYICMYTHTHTNTHTRTRTHTHISEDNEGATREIMQ